MFPSNMLYVINHYMLYVISLEFIAKSVLSQELTFHPTRQKRRTMYWNAAY